MTRSVFKITFNRQVRAEIVCAVCVNVFLPLLIFYFSLFLSIFYPRPSLYIASLSVRVRVRVRVCGRALLPNTFTARLLVELATFPLAQLVQSLSSSICTQRHRLQWQHRPSTTVPCSPAHEHGRRPATSARRRQATQDRSAVNTSAPTSVV